MSSKLNLKVRQVRALQTKHGITNLLNPTPDEAAKMASIDVLADIYFEGTRDQENAPDLEAIEDLTIDELVSGVKELLSDAGKSPA